MVDQEVLEKTYKRYLKGGIIDKELAYHTVYATIISDFRVMFEEFIKKLEKEFNEKYNIIRGEENND